MQIKLFTIPISDSGKAIEEMNRFLRGHKVLEVEQKLIQNEHGALWAFCVRYIQNAPPSEGQVKRKVDYREILDEVRFKTFSMLREGRKKIAKEEAIPAYAVFTDEELAGIAKLEKPDISSLKKINGVGEKKVEKYGKRILELFNNNPGEK